MSTKIKTNKANAFRGKIGPDSIELEFGLITPATGQSDNLGVALSDRVSLSPDLARRLLTSLEDALRQSPAVPAQDRQSGAAEFTGRASVRGTTPVNAPPDPAGEQSSLLRKLVDELAIPYQHERSFRIARGSLQANRYLLTMNRADIPPDPLQRTLDIARQLNMPESVQAAVADKFDSANCIHFGFEGAPEGIICKLYLESSVSEAERAAAIASGEPVLQHLAFKWVTTSGANVTTRYLWYPGAGVEAIRQRLQQVYANTVDHSSLQIATAILEKAAQQTTADKMQYLEVMEDQNQRRSFDLNIYQAALQVKDVQDQLNHMREHFDLKPGHFQALYDQIKNRSLGHLAGGVHRNDLDFFNIYYGAEAFPRFNEQLRNGT